MRIRRRCKCGCGGITTYRGKWINGHFWKGHKHSEETKRKMSLVKRGKKHSEETKRKMSLVKRGKKHSEETKRKMSLAGIGRKHSKETKIKMALSKGSNPNYLYCDAWKDKEYIKDLRKNYCENAYCKNNYKQLHNHHIYLNKKRCAPNEIMTLCSSCHPTLHAKLQEGKIPASPKDYIIINRPDHVSYIHKESRRIVKIKRK